METIGIVLVGYVVLGFVFTGATLIWGLIKMTIPTLVYIAIVTALVFFGGSKLGWDMMGGIGSALMFFWIVTYPLLVLAPIGGFYLLTGGERPKKTSSLSLGGGEEASNEREYADCGYNCYWNARGMLVANPDCEFHND